MKKFWVQFFTTIIVLLAAIAVFVCVVDPFYQYHRPVAGTSAYFYSQVYQSPGIIKSFDFDSLIIGTSMTENFRASWFKEMGYQTQKISYSGGTIKDLATLYELAFNKEPDLKFVWTDIEHYQLVGEPEAVFREVPEYLYNDFLPDDIAYWWNSDVFWVACQRVTEAAMGITHDTDDAYTWEDPDLFSKERVLYAYRGVFEELRKDTPVSQIDFEQLCETARANLKHYTDIIEAHPNTLFVYFFPPSSALYWHRMVLSDETWILDLYEYAAKELLQYDNVQVYCFKDEYDWITDLDMYRDEGHHSPRINRAIFDRIMNGENRLDMNNIDLCFDAMREWLQTYPFETLWEQ